MARTFSLGLVVALLLIFAVTEASRGQTNQTDGQKIQNRGTARFNSKSTTKSSNLSTSEIISPRDKSSHSEAVPDIEKHETHFTREGSSRSRSKSKQAADVSVTTSRTSLKHLNTNADNSRNRPKLHATQILKEEITRNTRNNNKENRPEPQTPKRSTASRRTSSDTSTVWVDNAKLDHEIFTKSPDPLRSRTGRKIYANDGRESKSEVIPTRKSPENENVEKVENSSSEPKKEETLSEYSRTENVTSKADTPRKIDTKSTNSSSGHKVEPKDVLLSGSESVRVDVPLSVGNEDANFLTSATVSSVSSRQASRPVKEKAESNDIARSSAKKNRQSDRSKSRNRSKTRDPYLETANSATSRRGSSKFDGTETAETNGRSSSSRHRSNAKNVNSRGRSTHKSRDAIAAEARSSGRQRNADADFETNANRRTETRHNDRRTSEGKRRSKDSRSKAVEAKVDEQDIRAQSRSRSRAPISNLEVTTAYIPKATIAEITTVPYVDTEIATSNSATVRPSTTARTSFLTERASRSKGRDRGESSRAKKPPKEDFFNHGLGFRGRKSSTEGSSTIVADPRSTTPKSETQLRGNPGWTLRRRPSHVNQDASSSTTSTPVNREQINEILSNDLSNSTETPLSNAKTGRRGTKRPKAKDESNTVSGIAAKSTTRGNKTFNKSESLGLPKRVEPESDNYPPAFRARLSQLKNSNSKPTGGKSTTRAQSSLQATKPSLASLFSERSKMKLELARRLIKPELNVDENDFDVTTAAYSGKSKAKEVSTVSESRTVEKTTKATSKLIGARATHGSSTSAPKGKSTVRGRWKILETRKSLKDRNAEAPFKLPAATIKKNRVTSERVEETSTRSVSEFAVPRLITVSYRNGVEETAATTIDTTKIRSPTSTTASREEMSTLANTVDALEENSIITTIEPLKLDKTFIETIIATSNDTLSTDTSTESKIQPTEFLQEVTLPPTVTTESNMLSSTNLSATKLEKLYPVYVPDAKEYNLLDNSEKTTTPGDTSKSSVRSRYTVTAVKQEQQADKVAVSMVTSRTVGPTSRYIRKKTGVFTPYDSIPKTSSTEATLTQTKRREFRPRTSTYRRHSEVPTSQVALQQPVTVEQTTAGVTITPKPTKFHSQVVTPSARSSPAEPFVSVRIDTSNNNTTSPPSGIAGTSNGNSGNSNVFNPTKSTYLNANTTTLIEQLRSTVAPLLNNLGDKTPIFSGAYSNVNTANSAPRITPNGSPPRFSARYKGAELFVRKPSVGQAVVPSITTSSTTASTPLENSGSAPPVAINSPGEPRFVTFYQALESASIRNENLGAEDVSQRQRLTGVVTKVDPNATVPNGAGNDIANNNDTNASITATTTSSPDTTTPGTTTTDTTTAVQSADNSLASRLGAESSTDSSPETTTTTVQTPTNSNGGETTPAPISESPGTTVLVNTITNTPPSDVNVPSTESLTTTEITTSTSVADVTSTTLSSTELVSDDIRSTETVNTSTEISTEVPTSTETTNARVSMPASQNLQTASDTTVPSPITESITVTHVPLEVPTTLATNDTSETNTVQQPEETTPRTTETTNAVEDIETNTVQQSDTTVPSQTTETTSIPEPTTTEEISNDIIEIRATAAPAFTSTYRTRLIDYAQDILSRLSGKDYSTLRTPIQRPTFTTTVFPDLFNTIPDSSSTDTGSSTQPEETTTVGAAGPGNVETTVPLDFDVELLPTTTNGPEETARNIVGSDTTTPQSQSNGQDTTTRNILDSSTTTEQTNIVGNTTSDLELTTIAQNTQAPSTNGEVTTVTPTPTSRVVESITENDPRSSNDTLLAELMTIAKTLFTEAMNDTVGNDNRNRTVSSNGTSEAIATPSEFSRPLESTTQSINVTTPIDLSGNEREDNSTRGPVVGSKISLVGSNARPAEVENPDVGDVTTMSLSQIKTETPNTIMVTGSMNSELTTNTPDSQLSNPIESSNNNIEQQTMTVANNEVELSDFAMDLTTNNTLTSSVTASTERLLPDVNESTTSNTETVMELTTRAAITEINVVQTNAVDTTNQTPEPTTIVPAFDLQVTNDQSLVTNASDIATTLPTISDTSVTQPFDTEPPATELVRNLSFIDTTTNRFNDITTNAPQTLTDLVSEMPNLIARLQETTSTTTAQGTAGSRIIQPEQTTETITTTTITTTVPNVTAPTTDSTTFPVSSTDATTIPSSSVEPTVTTTMTTTSTSSTEASSRSELTTTIGPTSETTNTTIDINENLVSTETTTDTTTTQGTTVTTNESVDLNMTSRDATTTTMTSAAPPTNNTSNTTITSTTARTTVLNRVPPFPPFAPFGASNTGSFPGRFGGNQATPAPPRLGSSKAPVRDYLIYGIYPNKTIVRKRPEDNLIDGRNVDSPYVIFGIYPDGRLVRKFPNGTIISDSPRNPVEVVFTLRTTTTTNRPAPRPYYNQANQAGLYNNQYQAPVYYSNGRPVDELTGGAQSPGSLDFGLIGNAIGVTPGGPNFAGPLGPPASVPSTNKMSDVLLNSQMGAIPNAAFGNLQTPNSGQVQGPIGPTIFQDRERNEASRSRVTSDQRSAVYIGEDKFINYQIDGAPDINPKVVDVRINSVATSVNEGTATSTASAPSFENLLNNQSGGGVITAPPGFPWRDPLDQIFGITTNSPIRTASVASNQLDEPTENTAPIMSSPINPLVEVFTPVMNNVTPTSTSTTTVGTTPTTTTVSTTIPTTTTVGTTTPITTSTTTTTTPAPTTTATTTTTTTMTTTTTSTTTPATTTTSQTAGQQGTVPPSSTASSTISTDVLLNRLQANTLENPFGTTFGDLAFLNSLLQNNVKSTTPKTLSEVEQLLANRILSLALANPGPTRSPKAIQTASLNANLNAIKNHPSSGSSSEPIIIDLLPASSPPSLISSTSPTKRYTETITTTKASTTSTITTRAPVVITAKPKTTARPKTTTPQTIGFGAGLWRALFGGNFFDATTAASVAKKTKPKVAIKASTQKPTVITQTPPQVIKSTLTSHIMSAIKSPTTSRSVDISDIHVASSTSLADSIIAASTPNTISTTLLNNPNPRLNDVSTSTYSPEDDAKFLAALLQALPIRTETSTTGSARLSNDDEAFLRAILSNQAIISSTTPSSTEVNPSALLALLLKQQGIEPTTPATNLRQQLQLSSLGLLTPEPTTIQPTTTNRPVSTARQVVTLRPTARPRPTLQTTTWAPSSTYPPPLFGGSGSSGSGLVTATRAIGRFLGAAISGAAQQLQSLLRNSTRSAAG